MSPSGVAERAAEISVRPPPFDAPIAPERAPKQGRPRRRWVLRLLALLVALLLPVAWSYEQALTSRGSAGWEMRTIEWLRDHGAGGTVDGLEVWYYTRHHPPTSGIPHGHLPALPTALQNATVGRARSAGLLPRLDPAVRPALPGEAAWRPGRPGRSGRPAIYTTWFRPDPHHPTLVAGLLWVDQAESRLELVAGTKDPGGGPWPGRSEVAPALRSRTLAAFNAGFLMRDAQGGFYESGRLARSLRAGGAAVVIRRNGRATVGQWGRDVRLSQNVSAVRQNLALIVDHGRAVGGLRRNNHFRWGSRRSQLEYVWRSGIGIDARGHLIYVAGDKFTLTTLAAALVQAHAIRAMELDIHFDEVTANLFTPVPGSSGALTATRLLPGMPRPATRYLQPDQRDFFTVTLG